MSRSLLATLHPFAHFRGVTPGTGLAALQSMNDLGNGNRDARDLARTPEGGRLRPLALAASVGLVAGTLFGGADGVRAAWEPAKGSALGWSTVSLGALRAPIAVLLSLQGPPAPASASVLSEHEIEVLDSMTPQHQAELLLERSINHYRGANQQIAARVDSWRGRIKLDDRLNHLFITALNSDDLRVRVAAIEVDLSALDLEKSAATVDRFEPAAREGAQAARVHALWALGLLGNRGVEPERVREILLSSIHDPNVNVRYWAVEGLAYLGTDETIAPLLDVFHDDPSPTIRERAACGLAQSGMLSEKQRRTAVPRLLDFADDFSLDEETRKWVFQALRDITGQSLGHDSAMWRRWHADKDREWRPVTRDGN